MINFSIQAIISPLISPVNNCFDKVTGHLISKHLESSPTHINHDLKALFFNAATIVIISTAVMAYLKIIYLAAAVALAGIFYLLRRVIDETMQIATEEKPEQTDAFSRLKKIVSATTSKAEIPEDIPSSPSKSWESYFYHEGTVLIGNVVIWKRTKDPMLQVLGMIIRRN